MQGRNYFLSPREKVLEMKCMNCRIPKSRGWTLSFGMFSLYATSLIFVSFEHFFDMRLGGGQEQGLEA